METKQKHYKDIEQFWSWFSSIYENFGESFENAVLLNELDMKVSKLGNVYWEIGPGNNTPNALTISPGGEFDMLSETKKIISRAPHLPNWEFYYAKQPKQWQFVFDFKKEDGIIREIDASDWKYVLLRYSDGKFEIIIEITDTLRHFTESEKLSIVEITIDGAIGEENRIVWLASLDIVEKLEAKYELKKGSIKILNEHLKTLIC